MNEYLPTLSHYRWLEASSLNSSAASLVGKGKFVHVLN
jgi:hypothetical protein